jgi:hypothetical protein
MDLHLATLGWAFATLAAAYGLGDLVLRALDVPWPSRAERAVFAMGLGLASIALLTLGLAAAHLLHHGFFLGLQAVLLLLAAPALARAVRDLRAWRPSHRDPLVVCLLAVAALLALLNASKALVPPTQTDTVAYHLTVPRLYQDHGGLFFFPYLVMSNWMYLTHMLHLWSLMLDGPQLALLLNHAVGFLAASAAGAVATRHYGGRAGAIAILIVIGIRGTKDSLGTGSDLFGLTLYTVLLAGAVIRWWETPGDRRAAALLGLCAGCCASAKLLGLQAVAVAFAACAGRALAGGRPEGPRRALALATASLLATAVAAPYFIKSWVLAGNPIHPFAYGLFGGQAWSEDAGRQLCDYLRTFESPERGVAGWVLLPLNAVVRESAFGLWLLPLALVLLPRDRRLALPLALFAALAILWWVGSPQPRFLLPARAVLAVPAAAGIAAAIDRLRPGRWRAAGTIVLAGLVIGEAGEHNLVSAVAQYRVVFDRAAEEAWRAERVPNYRAAAYINESLPPDARILLCNDIRGFYIRRPFVVSTPLFQGALGWGTETTPDALAALLCRHGVTHVLFNANDGVQPDGGALERLLARRGTLLHQASSVLVYRLEVEDIRPARRNAFRDPAPAAVTASSSRPAPHAGPERIIDGDACSPGRWISDGTPAPGRPEWVAVELAAPAAVSELRVFGEAHKGPLPVSFVVQARGAGGWEEIPETRIEGNRTESAWVFRLAHPVRSGAFRVLVTATTGGPAVLREVEGWGPAP